MKSLLSDVRLTYLETVDVERIAGLERRAFLPAPQAVPEAIAFRRTRAVPSCAPPSIAYLEGGRFPEQSLLCCDPTLALYHRLTGCRFVEILPGVAPQDHETAGLRVIAHATRADVLRPKNADGEKK